MSEKLSEKQKEYLIGDVANMVGLSRDALRFYEKKGVISARKKENGYRYYSEDDIYKLMYILYHRKMNTSLEEIEGLMSGKATTCLIREHIRQRAQEEREAIRHHRQAIARLSLMEKDMDRIDKSLDRCSVRKFPLAYVMGECENLQEGLKRWFGLSSTLAGLDMTYFYNILSYTGTELKNRGTRLLFYKELAPVLGDDFNPEAYPMTEELDCIYMIASSDQTLPDVSLIEKMVRWGESRGIEAEGTVYANDMTSFFSGDTATYFLELYMPIRRVVVRM